MQSRVVATLVVGLGILLAAAVLVRLAIGSEPDYARLVPAPDSIIWEKGQESTILISTNLDDVYLRIDSVAMGIESVQSAVPHSGELKVPGRQRRLPGLGRLPALCREPRENDVHPERQRGPR